MLLAQYIQRQSQEALSLSTLSSAAGHLTCQDLGVSLSKSYLKTVRWTRMEIQDNGGNDPIFRRRWLKEMFGPGRVSLDIPESQNKASDN